jgi:hypothetical protein
MKKSRAFELHRGFKEGWEYVQEDARSWQLKTRRTDANVDRVRTFVRSDRRLGTRLIAEGLDMNKETVRHYYGGFENKKNFRKCGEYLESWQNPTNCIASKESILKATAAASAQMLL